VKKEELIQEMKEKIEACKSTTWYNHKQIELMKENGEKLVGKMYVLQGTTYLLREDDKEKEVLIEFDRFKFGHNDFFIYCKNFDVKKCMKEIFQKMREDGTIGGQGSDGWGTAFVLSYEPWKRLN